MRLVCSYCQKDMGTKPPLRDGSVSHGMCPPCGEYFGAQWDGMGYGEYLERFAFPVLMMEEDFRVVATNRSACNLLGREAGEVAGLLGGEALECGRARLPGGCGKTVHCSTCAIRNTVTATRATGRAMTRVPALLRRGDGVRSLLVSTQLEGPLVRVTVEGA
jgi:PAS domain-containing protein